MSKVLVNEASLTAIGDAIRSKNGTEDKYKPSEMAAAIGAISVGSGVGDGLVLGGAVTAIGASAFEGDEGITSASIPESVASIGASAFADCVNMTDLYFGAANMSDLGVSDKIFARAGQNGGGIKVVFGSKVARVPGYLFYGYGTPVSAKHFAYLASVEFEEESVCTEIGEKAFYYCKPLTSFKAPTTLASIGTGAFNSLNASVAVLDFSACAQIPALSDSDIDASTIYVPAALYDEWIVATNWAAMADRIVAK